MATLNKAAAEAMKEAGASACTDVTGFGLFAHLLRMLRQSKLGAEVFADALPAFAGALEALRQGVIPGAIERNREYVGEAIRVAPDVDEALVHLGFDAQTSGGLLIAIPAGAIGQVAAVSGAAQRQRVCHRQDCPWVRWTHSPHGWGGAKVESARYPYPGEAPQGRHGPETGRQMLLWLGHLSSHSTYVGGLGVCPDSFRGTAKQGSIAPQVVHSRQRMQPETLTFWSTFTPIEQRLRQRLHSTHSLGLNRRWNRLKRLNSASKPPSGQKMRHQGR